MREILLSLVLWYSFLRHNLLAVPMQHKTLRAHHRDTFYTQSRGPTQPQKFKGTVPDEFSLGCKVKFLGMLRYVTDRGLSKEPYLLTSHGKHKSLKRLWKNFKTSFDVYHYPL